MADVGSGSAADMLRQTWTLELRQEAKLHDIFTALEGSYNSEDKLIPAGIVMKHQLAPGAFTDTISLIMNLTGAGIEGDGILTGNTEVPEFRSFKVYANEVRHGVSNPAYGKKAFQNSPYKIMEKLKPLLGEWFKAREGRHAREALVECRSGNITEVGQHLNKNWFVKGCLPSEQPVYDSTLSDFIVNLNGAFDKMETAHDANSGADPQVADVDFLTALQHQIFTVWKIEPSVGDKVVVTLSSEDIAHLSRLSQSNGLLSKAHSSMYPEFVKAAFNQEIINFGRLIIMEDVRSPVLDWSEGGDTFVVKYADVTDGRTVSGTKLNVGFVLGKGALTKAIMEDLHFNDEYYDFEKVRAIGASATYGYNLTQFDHPSPTNTTLINQNSGIIVTRGHAVAA